MKNDGIANLAGRATISRHWLHWNEKRNDGGRWIASKPTTASNTSLAKSHHSVASSVDNFSHFPGQWSTKTTSFECLIRTEAVRILFFSRRLVEWDTSWRQVDSVKSAHLGIWPTDASACIQAVWTSTVWFLVWSLESVLLPVFGQLRAERPYPYLRSN